MIPNKSNFKFQELTPITGVKPYVIRFWETEFDDIAPVTSDSGQKLYARKDVEAIFKIKKLLFDEKMTIPEAKIAIKNRDIEVDTNPMNGDEITPMRDSGADKVVVRNVLLESLNLIKDIKRKRSW
jgi:DNA-binding transcriptional MerR regulator